MLNLDKLPGILTLIGTLSALAGIIFIAKGDKLRRIEEIVETVRTSFNSTEEDTVPRVSETSRISH